VHTSPHDIADYEEEIFPVASSEIGRIGTAICYDWLFPEVLRELSLKGAEILLRVSAYMDPFGAHEPNDWWTVVNRCRALENIAYVVAANQGASLENYPPFSWPGGSMGVDYDGRGVVQATPGNGEKITVGPIDVGMVRYQRQQRQAHQMLVHLRTDAHAIYRKEIFKGGDFSSEENRTYDDNAERIAKVRKDLNRTRQSD
jgi:predicted amidohydrolase